MRIFYAPLRALENKFVDYAASLQPGPQRRVLVLCPSARTAATLRRLCVQKTGVISNVFFVTFSQLLARLNAQSPAAQVPLLPADNLHDYILKKLLSAPGLGLYKKPSRGFISALKASLRDLGDSLADPDVLEEHLQTTSDPLLLNQQPHLQWLINVYRAYLQKMDAVPGYRSYRQYFEDALSVAQASPWLQSFTEILVYGFYEFTGRQLDLFSALRTHYPVTVFWPYSSHPAFEFGRKFFETNILGAGAEAQALPGNWSSLAAGEALEALFSPRTSEHTPQNVHFVSAADAQAEVFFAVKEMLRLHEQEGMPFEDMALCARSLEGYKAFLPAVCAQNGVPLNADFAFNFTSLPLGVFLTNLFSLARGGFDREDVLAVVTSPYFKRPNRWRYLIDECLAKRDFGQWADLLRPTLSSYDPAFLTWLEGIKTQLEFLEKPLAWNTLCAAAAQLVQDNVCTEGLSPAEQQVLAEWQNVLNGFARYNAVAQTAQEGEFLDELFSALQDVRLHQTAAVPGGVSVLDALAMRGQGFKAVFLLGLNEKSFPQAMHEDPMLKDYYRRVLRDQLGFWINPKMERFNEERLLFFCALEAAADKLYLSCLRSDAEGKPLVISGYLAEFARAAKTDLQTASRYVSGRLSERLKTADLASLSAKELSLLLAAESAPEENYLQAGLLDEGDSDSLHAARQMAGTGTLNAFDGKVQSGREIFASQHAAGFSPSALQDLARCPMKYFLAKGLGLKEKDEVLSRSELAPDLRGTAYHQILMDYYQRLYKEGLAGQLFAPALEARLDEAVNKNYNAQSYKQFGIYPVIWDMILKDIRDKLADFVVQDAEHLDGFVPSVFETQFEKIYSPSANVKMKLKGIIDRIDVNAQNKTFRVLDYKSGRHGGKDLTGDMFKKIILQPFIYLILAQDQPPTRGLTPDGAALLNINKGYNRQELTAQGFEAVRPRAEKFLTLLPELICGGTFFVSPGDHCQYCPYGAICRKDAYRTLLRVKHTPQAGALEEAKQ